MSRNLRDAKIHFLYGICAGDQKNLTNIITYESNIFPLFVLTSSLLVFCPLPFLSEIHKSLGECVLIFV